MVQTISRRKVLVGAASTAAALALPDQVAAEPTTHEIRIKSFAFVPQHITVRVGDKLVWINEDLAPHTATADGFGWDTGELGAQQSAEVVVVSGMELTYFCAFHPHMRGRISVA